MRSKQHTPWSEKTARQKATSIGSILGCFLGAAILAYAASSLFTHDSFTIQNTKGQVVSIDLTGAVEGIEVVPGTEQSVSPSITNNGTEPMYVFVRFDVGVTSSGTPVYSFDPDDDSWTAVDTGEAGELLYVYGSGSTPVAVNSQEIADLSGVLTCIASGSDFVMLDDVSVSYRVCDWKRWRRWECS